jgi:3-hydroxyisobutyrate dehydrogenase
VRRHGFELVVHDLRRPVAQRLLDEGAAWADDPAAVAEAVDVVITSLPGPPEVRAVLEGPRGVIAGIRPGAGWIDMSTTDFHQTQRLAATLADKRVAVLEATVTGGVANAWKRKAALFVGGAEADYARYRPVLEAISERILYMGPLGSASVTKLITNIVSFAHEQALAEGLALGARAGLDPGPLLEAIRSSYGGSFVADVDGPNILNGSYYTGFSIGLASKDAHLALDLAREVDAPLHLFPLVAEQVDRIRDAYGAQADCLVTARLYEDEAGLLLRPKE